MYITKQIQISKTHKLSKYFDDLCHKANNLYNATVFLIRQYATAKQSFETMKPLYNHQLNVYNLVESNTKDTQFHPKDESKWLNYRQIDFIFKKTENTDYRALPAQCSQQIIKVALRDFKGYFESIKRWKVNSAAFTGMPRMPGYKTSGGSCTAIVTNQDCKIKDTILQFPGQRKLDIASIGATGTLKEVRVKPSLIDFTIDIVFETPIDGEIINDDRHNDKLLTKYKDYTTLNERALAIDTGLSNLCTVVNNFGSDNFIIKGTILKSINQWYNKQLAYYQSIAKKSNNRNWTLRLERITRKRNNQIKDYMHKTTAYIANYAKTNNVNIVVIGHNKNQKQEINIGKVNNQNFVQIPTTMLINQLQYKLNRLGIELVVVEESYTSQASFENLDFLPTYGINDDKANFSGKRIKRGLYQSYDQKEEPNSNSVMTGEREVINADVNGAANIFRKVFPNVREWDRGVVATPVLVHVA